MRALLHLRGGADLLARALDGLLGIDDVEIADCDVPLVVLPQRSILPAVVRVFPWRRTDLFSLYVASRHIPGTGAHSTPCACGKTTFCTERRHGTPLNK